MPKRQFLFSTVFGFRNPTKEIFSELDEINAHDLIFPGSFQRSEGETKRGHRGAKPKGGAAPPLAAPACGVGPLLATSDSPSMFWVRLGKIEG